MTWWLAGGAIDGANVLEHVENPSIRQAYAGATATTAWSIAVKTIWNGGNAQSVIDSQTGRAILGVSSAGLNGFFFSAAFRDVTLFLNDGTEHIYFLVCSGSFVQAYRDNVAIGAAVSGTTDFGGGTTRWRGIYTNAGTSDWATAVAQGACYNIALDSTQRSALYSEMAGLTGTIAISTPVTWQTFQRNPTTGSIPITGTYTGTPTSIEASFNGGAYSTIVASPSGGTYSGTLTGQATGRGTLTVRFTDTPAILATASNIAVGDVFAWIGQSNQDGRFTSGQTYTGSITASIYDEAGAWSQLSSSYKSPGESTFSVLPLLASLISDAQSVPVAFIAETEGGTGLVTPDADWSNGGANYEAFVATYAAAAPGGLKAFLWYQGERDAVNAIAAATYQAALSQMLDDLQTDTSTTAPMIVAMIAQVSTATDAGINGIRAAQVAAWIADADIYPGPTGHDQTMTDGVHWTTNGQATILAGRWWRTIAAALYSGSDDGRGPRLSTATYNGSVVTVIFTGGAGSLANATDATGWRVTDNSGARTISGAAASGSNGIALTVSGGALATPVTVSFDQGDDTGSTLVDSGTYPLPPEPIVSQAATLASSIPVFMATYRRRRV